MIKYLTHTDNHLEIARGYLLEQYKHKPNIDGLLAAIIEPLQVIEDQLYNFYEQSSIIAAKGCFLDRIGAITGEDRNYRKDAKYRLAILIKIIANNGGASTEEILVILQNIYDIKYIEYFETTMAYFQIYIEAEAIPIGINKMLRQLKPAGVAMPAVIYSDADNVFRFSEHSKTNARLIVKNTVAISTTANATNTIDTSCLRNQTAKLKSDDMQISFDSYAVLQNASGYAEIIVHRFDIDLDDHKSYLVNEDTALETIMSYQDFTIEGGGVFAEVLQNA